MSFNKLILIPKSEYEKFTSDEAKNLHADMIRTKKDGTLSRYEKKIKFQNKLSTFLDTSKKLREPIKLSIEPDKASSNFIKPEALEENLTVQKLKEIPSDLRRRAYTLYERLKLQPGVYESANSVVINNTKLNHNLFKYVAEAIRPKTIKKPLRGYSHVVKLMHRSNVKMPSIAHDSYRSKLNNFRLNRANLDDSTQSGSGCPLKNWKNYRFT